VVGSEWVELVVERGVDMGGWVEDVVEAVEILYE
jgi:hypothetical protein